MGLVQTTMEVFSFLDPSPRVVKLTSKTNKESRSDALSCSVTGLHLDLDSALSAGPALTEVGEEVGDIVPRMTVETGAQSLLVEVVGNETDAATQDEETVEDTHGEVILSLLRGEGTAVAEEIDEADSNAAIDVEDQVVLLGGGDGLDGQGVVEELVAGELGKDVLLDKLDTQIGVVAGLDAVTDTGDELVGLAHAVDELAGAQVLVESLGELLGSTVEGTTEAGADGQETGNEGRDEVLAGTGGDDGVHGTRHGRTVIGSKHENHLEELGGVVGQSAAEPQKRHDTADTDVLSEDVGDGHTGVQELLATVIGNGGDEGSRLADEAKLLGPRVVDGDLGNDGLGLGNDGALLDEILVDLGKDGGHVLEGLGDVETSLAHGLVLHGGGLELGVGERTGVTELNLGLEHAGASTNGPGDNGLGDDALLDGLNDLVLFDATDLTEEDEDLAVRVGLVAEHVVDEGGTGVAVTTNGDTLVDTVGVLRDDVVQLVGHTTRLRDVADGALAVELGGDNVVHHATSVTNLEAAGLDATDGSGTNDGHTLLLGDVGNLASAALGDTLGNDGNGLDLGVLHELHGGAVDTARRGKVDNDIYVGVLSHSLADLLVDGQESLRGAPVHLADELATEGVDDSGNGGGLALADEVKVKHTLDGAGLETVDEASCLVVEESVLGERAQRAAGSAEALDVVVGRQVAVGSGGSHCSGFGGGEESKFDR